MMKAGRSRMKHLIRGEVVQKRGGKSVDNVDSLLYGEVPKVMSQVYQSGEDLVEEEKKT